jgi:serine/threonine protein kinase
MKSLKFHPNLVCMLGYVHDVTNPLLVLEYCKNGDLLRFIRLNKSKFVNVNIFCLLQLIVVFLGQRRGSRRLKN